MSQAVDIEIILKTYKNNTCKKFIIEIVQKYLEKNIIYPNSIITDFQKDDPVFQFDVEALIIGDVDHSVKTPLNLEHLEIHWFLYTLNNNGPVYQNEDYEDGEIVVSTQLTLPSSHLQNLWENLYYENNLKQNLLKYAQTMMEFSDKGVDNNIISCNRVILLHGPPGTGKTSLCKALAQKLTIRMSERFTSGILIEINSHSLFSKWFSESGKLVTQMFSKIMEIVENKNILVCVLIDEVESLAHARNQCVSGNEPSDSIRVVNALLTQIDKVKTHSNILIFATSNMTGTIDLAFVDRADIKQYLGIPTVPAIYMVYSSCINELIKTQIIKGQQLHLLNTDNGQLEEHKVLLRICEQSLGLSGRSLRKVPFVAHALFLEKSLVSLMEFLDAMEKAIAKEKTDRNYFEGFKQEPNY